MQEDVHRLHANNCVILYEGLEICSPMFPEDMEGQLYLIHVNYHILCQTIQRALINVEQKCMNEWKILVVEAISSHFRRSYPYYNFNTSLAHFIIGDETISPLNRSFKIYVLHPVSIYLVYKYFINIPF